MSKLNLNDVACANLKMLVDAAVKVYTGEIDLDDWATKQSQNKDSDDVVLDRDPAAATGGGAVCKRSPKGGLNLVIKMPRPQGGGVSHDVDVAGSSSGGQNRKRSHEEIMEVIPHRVVRNIPHRVVRNNIPRIERPCEAVYNHIVGSGGLAESVVLVMEKNLSKTDVSDGHNRLSIPHGTAKKLFEEKLSRREAQGLVGGRDGISVTLVEPSLSECDMSLKNWDTNSQFALVTAWKDVVKRNGLREGMSIQLWLFRRRDQSLCFALVKTP